MEGNKRYLGLLIAGMSLGTAWAIRGQFGHEQGAAWAGSIGALSVILIAKRTDWYNKAISVTLAAALGWGIGGIMSYGRVVGFGRGVDFGNVYYGLLMLFIIGGLHGFLGGGLFGLALADSPIKRVKWHLLIVEMVIGALITYFFLIEEWGWLMTPPRSELWAACLGMAFALAWHMTRNQYYAPLRVALFGCLGGGFGFGFGNFLQVMGSVSQIHFNFWNVMEYSIGFFGGVGMAYGTFTSSWDMAIDRPKRSGLLFPLLMLVLVIPFIVWDQSFGSERVEGIYKNIAGANFLTTSRVVQLVALALLLIMSGVWIKRFYWDKAAENLSFSYVDIRAFFIGHWGLYIAYSFLITGAFMSDYRIEQYLYVANILVITALLGKIKLGFADQGVNFGRWAIALLVVLIFMALITLVAINSHGELNGMNRRFE